MKGSQGYVAALRTLGLVLLLCGLALPVAWSQINTGSIAGSITDSSGAAIPAATVNAVEAESGTKYTTTSSSTGYYVFASVRPGRYTLTASAGGFSLSTTNGVAVDISTRASQDLKLAVGTANQTVEVQANGQSLETETSDIGTVITSEQVLDLPLAAGGAMRSLSTLTFLTPGAVGPGTSGGTVYTKIGGGQTEGSDFLLDGISTLRSENGSGQFDQTTPSVDSIQEFRVQTFSLPSYIGRTTGGVSNYKTRSGTNTYHGTIYDFFRNTIFDANDYFNKGHAAQGGNTPALLKTFARSPDLHNDYGATLGGPLYIPHVYNGKDKTFFFFNFEQVPTNHGYVASAIVPTAAQRMGDFSSTLGAAIPGEINPCTGQPILSRQIFDPNTTQTVATVNGNVQCRMPFVNNQVPLGRSKVAANLLALLPTPNASLPGGVNYTANNVEKTVQTDYSIRVDQNFGSRNHIFFFGNARENFDSGASNLPDPVNSGSQLQDLYAKYGRVGWTYTITPRLVSDFTIGGNRINSFNTSPAARNGINYDSQLGIPNTPGAGTTFPIFNLGETLTGVGSANFDDNVDNALIANEALSLQLGRHSIQFGGTFRWQQFSYINSGPAAGGFNFARAQTAGSDDPTAEAQSGNSFASFLLGVPSSTGRTVQLQAPRWIQTYYAGYLQDDFKLRKNLTLNLGFRYSIDNPRHEAGGDISSFDPTVPNPSASGILGALRFGGVGTGRDGNKNEQFADTYYKNFEPRIGASFSLDQKTVLRAAYTIMYGPLQYSDYGQGLNTGFTNSSPPANNNPFLPSGSLDAGPLSVPTMPNLAPGQLLGGTLDYVEPGDGKPAMVQNYSLEMQRELAPDLILTMGFLGQRGTRLRSLVYYPNTIPESALALGNLLFAPVTSTAAVAAGIKVPYANFTSTTNGLVGQALRPFPQYGYLNNDSYLQNRGQSTYDALEVKLERRFHSGLNVLASYTWSKTLTDADSIQPFFATVLGQGGTQNPYNLKGEKAVSTQDVPTNFVISYLYELPVGKGKKFLGNSNKLVNALVGGYRVGGIQRYLSGQPISFFGEPEAPQVQGFDGTLRYNVAPGVDKQNPVAHSGSYNVFNFATNPNPLNVNPTGFFNKAAFIDQNDAAHRGAGAFTFGDLPRNSADQRTPAYFNEDLNISKHFMVRENIGADLRFELFNAFNRHVFGKPDSGVNDNNFGQITGLNDAARSGQLVLKLNF